MQTKFLKISLFLLFLPGATFAYEIDQLTFNTLPPHCQAFYAELQAKGKLSGFTITNPKKYQWNLWARRIGNPSIFMNHYCPGLAELNRAKLSSKKRNNTTHMRLTKDNIHYLIRQSRWTKSNAWLRAEAEMKLAELAELMGNTSEAVSRYEESIKTYSKSYRPYLGLSKLLDRSGNPKDALAVIRKGIDKNPRSKTLKRQEKRLLDKM